MTKKRLEREMISEKETKEKAKPEIEVDLSEKTFKPNYWKTLYLLVRNKGNAHAKDVKINFSKEQYLRKPILILLYNNGYNG